ncbi:MAG TPA: BlaI/MecI/CopY family transcriptional regulator [Verrucomicrobiota bacterium]|nr:BlaI/MecI/CopY family transcriptional regulator [Verrucomicrobiota bacterium]
MPSSIPELTEAEWAIMKAVWAAEPCAAPTVQEALVKSHAWTYSTVRTLMDRMVGKGFLTAEKIRNLTLYRTAVTRRQAQLGELRYALRHAFDGALKPMVETLLSSEKLSAEELDELESMIAARRRSSPSTARKSKS